MSNSQDYIKIRAVQTETSEEFMGRLYNGKPESSLKYIEGQPQDVIDDVNILIRCFGNDMGCGGVLGELGAALLATIIGQED